MYELIVIYIKYRFLSKGFLRDFPLQDGSIISTHLLLCGGIDFQHREGSKVGSGGQLSESQAALERKERLRKLALETIDISKDPYFMRNHVGTYECKLCLTLHPNEGNYLAHTQGKRHQYNLGRRAAMEAKNAAPRPMVAKEVTKKPVMRIGRPGYKVFAKKFIHI
jgi:splicing factor 3A subunit 2